jgi:hypothetical protein
MWRYDFHLFYQAGQAVWAGTSPYLIADFNPPYPLAVLFALFALLPEPLAYLVYLALSLLLVWKVLGRRGLWALLSFPVFFGLFVGQVDLPLTLLVVAYPWAWPVALIKPQVGFVVLPWLLRHTDRKALTRAAWLGLALVALCFLLRPTWVTEWLAATPTLTQYAQRDANLYWLVPTQFKTAIVISGALGGLLIGVAQRERRDAWIALHLLAPLTNLYSASVLAEWIGPLEAALSWLVMFLLGGDIHHGAPLFVVGLSIWGREIIERLKDKG